MGPNAIIIANELILTTNLQKGMKVLDLGCGKALTSMYLAQQFGVTVFAVDLWTPATENQQRIEEQGFEDYVFPIHADVHNMPFANEFFDAVIAVDSYHYFGGSDSFLYNYITPLLKKGGQLAVAVPGFNEIPHSGFPLEFEPFWSPEMNTFHTKEWWLDLWTRSGVLNDIEVRNMRCCREAWESWLNCDNEYAKDDKAFYGADKNDNLAIISMTAIKK